MQYNADLLKRLTKSNLLPERPGQVVCAYFIGFDYNDANSTITRRIATVCPHNSNGTTQNEYRLDVYSTFEPSDYLFTPKNIDSLFVYGRNDEEKYPLFKLYQPKQILTLGTTRQMEEEVRMVGDYLLFQGPNVSEVHDINQPDGKYKYEAVNDGLFNISTQNVMGTIENGDLWFPNKTCKTLKPVEVSNVTEHNLVAYDCPNPEKLLLPMAQWRVIKNVRFERIDGNATDFAMLYYAKAPKATTTTTVVTNTTTSIFLPRTWVPPNATTGSNETRELFLFAETNYLKRLNMVTYFDVVVFLAVIGITLCVTSFCSLIAIKEVVKYKEEKKRSVRKVTVKKNKTQATEDQPSTNSLTLDVKKAR
ncbi:unnamed protein product [Bursaphelenchus okinawaensis]|uniref:Uncharacterized protein n=1 Tax=Bursaphelenchus okinawaensis TaxID=465554 RepID=A0A811K1Q5_9BILA|nr:unnamed protein product [Bursaphelenchus okinawaensis]CAG9090158.1 unnamed protein product [Bursaphelenchus okinawaensis]